jgi:hypothetical protein
MDTIPDHLHLRHQGELSLDEFSQTCSWILKHVDCFVSQSRGNSSIERLFLNPYSFNVGQEERVWERVGEGIGNFQALTNIDICSAAHDTDVIPDWGRLTCILRHVRQSVTINIEGFYQWYHMGPEEILPFVQAIHGHPTITSFEGGDVMQFPNESMSMLYSALATLPALESVHLNTQEPDDGVSTLANPETLTELLRVVALRSVKFSGYDFTRALCQATANALTEGTEITDLIFKYCSFSDGECAAMMANGLSRNTSVTSLQVEESSVDEALSCAVAAAVVSNSTLRHISYWASGGWLPNVSPIFLALGKNTGLSTLLIRDCKCIDGSLCTAMEYGLGKNESLRELKLLNIVLDDNNFALWCRALSFLRINKTLRVLRITMEHNVAESCACAFRMHIATMLHENTSLDDISMETPRENKAKEYVALLSALRNNTTLKILRLGGFLHLAANEDKEVASLLKKNYGLKMLPGIHRAADVSAILQLNAAGRRYLIQDGSSISKGVDVLSNVSMNINCVFLHLLENPRLCDRGVVEIVK